MPPAYQTAGTTIFLYEKPFVLPVKIISHKAAPFPMLINFIPFLGFSKRLSFRCETAVALASLP